MQIDSITYRIITVVVIFNGIYCDLEDTSDTDDTSELQLRNFNRKEGLGNLRFRRNALQEIMLSTGALSENPDDEENNSAVHLPINLRKVADPRSFIIPRDMAGHDPDMSSDAENYHRLILQAISDNYTQNAEAGESSDSDDYEDYEQEYGVDYDYDPEEWAHTWRERQRAKNLRLLMVQRQILRKLHMRITPNISSSVLSTQQQGHIVETYERNYKSAEESIEDHHEDIFSKRFKSYVPTCELPKRAESEAWEDPDMLRLHFDPDIPEISPTGSHINYTATLRLYKTAMQEQELISSSSRQARHIIDMSMEPDVSNITSMTMTDEHIKICVHKYLRPVKMKKRGRLPEKELVSYNIVERTFEGWVKLNLTSAVEHWFAKPNKNFGIVITIEDVNGNDINTATALSMIDCMNSSSETPLYEILNEDSSTNSSYNTTIPVLDILTVEKSSLQQSGQNQDTIGSDVYRQKRGVHYPRSTYRDGNIDLNTKINDCHRMEMVIDFEEIGWNWLIQPKRLDVGYCTGPCKPHASAQPNTCKMSKTEGVTILYFNNDSELKYGFLPGLKITQCDCLPKPEE